MAVLNRVGLSLRNDALGGSPSGGNGPMALSKNDLQNYLLSYLVGGSVFFDLGYGLRNWPLHSIGPLYILNTGYLNNDLSGTFCPNISFFIAILL